MTPTEAMAHVVWTVTHPLTRNPPARPFQHLHGTPNCPDRFDCWIAQQPVEYISTMMEVCKCPRMDFGLSMNVAASCGNLDVVRYMHENGVE
ncbi:hypothetical protein HDU76_009856, partial [Blyttiomyces sp. JEL0837]